MAKKPTTEFPKMVYNPKSELDEGGAYSEREIINEASEMPKGWTDKAYPERETDKPAPKPKSGGKKTAKKDAPKEEPKEDPFAGLDMTEEEARTMLAEADVEVPDGLTPKDIAKLVVDTFGDNG